MKVTYYVPLSKKPLQGTTVRLTAGKLSATKALQLHPAKVLRSLPPHAAKVALTKATPRVSQLSGQPRAKPLPWVFVNHSLPTRPRLHRDPKLALQPRVAYGFHPANLASGWTAQLSAAESQHEKDNRILAAGALISELRYTCEQDYGLPSAGLERMAEAIRDLLVREQNDGRFYSQLAGYQFHADAACELSDDVAALEHEYIDYQGRTRRVDILLNNGVYVECKAYAIDGDPPLDERQQFRAQARAYARSGANVAYRFKNGIPDWCRVILAEEFSQHDINWNASREDITG